MNKALVFGIAAAVLLVIGLGGFFIIQATSNPNDETPEVVATPPEIKKINSLPLSDRPFVTLIPHSNPARCDGVDLMIDSLKMGEAEVEYDLEYTNKIETGTKIEGMFGRRDFTQDKDHDPLEFGTCSRGRCVCHDEIQGGSIKLSFTGTEDYVLKGDFAVENVGQREGVLVSKDVRLTIETGDVLGDDTDVMIMNTFGVPGELTDKIILGPYGVFVEDNPELDGVISATIQSKDAANAKVQLWNGDNWQVLESAVDENVISFEMPSLGVVVLTE